MAAAAGAPSLHGQQGGKAAARRRGRSYRVASGAPPARHLPSKRPIVGGCWEPRREYNEEEASMLPLLRATRTWPRLLQLAVMAAAVGITYLLQLPLEADVPGDPFLLF